MNKKQEEHMSNLREKAYDIARAWHANQTDFGGNPYSDHLRAVAVHFAYDAELFAAAILHDILEDTACTPQGLADAGIPDRVIDIIQILTWDKQHETYTQYINRVACDKEARMIKLKDLENNFSRGHGRPDLHRRYLRAYEMIHERMINDVMGAIWC